MTGLPVRVRLYVSGQSGACSPERLAPWVAGLGEHLRSALGDAERLGRAAQFIAIEDFNTQGLCGSTTAARESDLAEKKNEHFYFFWRNIGIAGKAASERGSWGLGKLVYPAASHCRAMFGLSVRASDQREYLMGLAGLRQHAVRQTLVRCVRLLRELRGRPGGSQLRPPRWGQRAYQRVS